MTIDWFTFTAQILNFLILIWLMKRFLYGPIVSAMDQREARIAERLTDAARAKEAAAASEREYNSRIDELKRRQDSLLSDAAKEVESWRETQLRSAREAVEEAREEWSRSLSRDKQSLLRTLQLDVARHATNVARHLLKELADEQLQARIVARFLKLLGDVAPETRRTLANAHREQAIHIEVSHDLSDNERSGITAALEQLTGCDAEISFRRNSQLVCGIELHAPGCKLAWSIREVLAELESGLIDSLDDAIPAAALPTRSATHSARRPEQPEEEIVAHE